MTSNSNPNNQPTAPGWWWARNAWGEVNAILVWIEDGVIYDNSDPFKRDVITESECVEWLGPVLSHDEGKRLQEENRILRGTIDAQDEREQRAGVACGVPYELSTCDWPDAVADEVLALRQRVADLEAQQARVMGAIDEQRLREELRLTRGAMDAQDDRERQAGEKCGVSYEEYGCDWPDAVADEVLALRQRVAELDAAKARMA